MTSPTKAAVLLAAMSVMASSVVTPMPSGHYAWKAPNSKGGNNRAQRRAKNKAAQKTRAQQRRKAKKG